MRFILGSVFIVLCSPLFAADWEKVTDNLAKKKRQVTAVCVDLRSIIPMVTFISMLAIKEFIVLQIKAHLSPYFQMKLKDERNGLVV